MSNLIDRQAVIDALKKDKATLDNIIRSMSANDVRLDAYVSQRNQVNYDIFTINTFPSAQPETAKRIVGRSRDGMTLWYQCDMCNEPVDAQDNYCRGCGRRLTDG